jgi:hypothetical protein
MQTTFALIAALASVAPALAAPAGCSPSYSGKFEITAYNLSSVAKRDIEKVCFFIMMSQPIANIHSAHAMPKGP